MNKESSKFREKTSTDYIIKVWEARAHVEIKSQENPGKQESKCPFSSSC